LDRVAAEFGIVAIVKHAAEIAEIVAGAEAATRAPEQHAADARGVRGSVVGCRGQPLEALERQRVQLVRPVQRDGHQTVLRVAQDCVAHRHAHGISRLCLVSKSEIFGSSRSVSPISSQPFSRHCLRYGSISNAMQPPSGPRISCFSRSIEITALAPRSASSISLSISSCGSAMGKIPFLKQLL